MLPGQDEARVGGHAAQWGAEGAIDDVAPTGHGRGGGHDAASGFVDYNAFLDT